MSANPADYGLEPEDFAACVHCGEEHPLGVLDDGYCPACVDLAPEDDEDPTP